MPKAKTMNRSRNQLASSYAPESFFTFEGGVGGCIARSTSGEDITLEEATQSLIFERLEELGQAWFDAAMSARSGDPTKPVVLPAQCVDSRLLNMTRNGFQVPGLARVRLCKPSHMGYTPAPLSFVCRKCSLFRHFDSLRELDEALDDLDKATCDKGGRCHWQQLDVIFVHWSGNWAQPFPGQYHFDDAAGKVVKRMSSCVCGHEQFRLNRRSASIGKWFFTCAKCAKPLSMEWRQNDEVSAGIIGPGATSPARLTEVRMEATPYRASSAYYVKQDLFIDFKEGAGGILRRLRTDNIEALKDLIAREYGLGAAPVTDQQVLEACGTRSDCESARLKYQSAMEGLAEAAAADQPDVPLTFRRMAQHLREQAEENKAAVVKELRDRGLLAATVMLPSGLEGRLVNRRSLFASKYDPFRLAVEHKALRSTRLEAAPTPGGKPHYVSFAHLDPDLSPETAADRAQLEVQATTLFQQLGIEDMGLIRQFDLCRFTFGYTRMESTPVLRDKRGTNMPVRLNLFPDVRHDGTLKAPIYVVQQGNEALYVRLRPATVMGWLRSLNCPDMFELPAGAHIGVGLLECATDMNPFLDRLQKSTTPPVYYYAYTLLHSYAHLVMKHVAEYSGLDLGSLGEYIFPADLAFVVYRNGTTMDLGNLSAMWRNAGIAMLRAMAELRSTLCGTGSLCTERGGACPDCIMVPETSCIAFNKLLSRSVLRSVGGRAREFDERIGSICGYLDFTQAS